jgi:hypothetical protein
MGYKKECPCWELHSQGSGDETLSLLCYPLHQSGNPNEGCSLMQ